jgi:hypothetical protein
MANRCRLRLRPRASTNGARRGRMKLFNRTSCLLGVVLVVIGCGSGAGTGGGGGGAGGGGGGSGATGGGGGGGNTDAGIPGDSCGSQITLSLTQDAGTWWASATGDTTPARNDVTSSCTHTGMATHDLVYKVVAPADGFATLTVIPKAGLPEPVVGLWTGASCATATELLCKNTLQTAATVQSQVSQGPFWIWVTDFEAVDNGSFDLTVQFDE